MEICQHVCVWWAEGVQLDTTCFRCGAAQETGLHAVRDCPVSWEVWNVLNFIWDPGPDTSGEFDLLILYIKNLSPENFQLLVIIQTAINEFVLFWSLFDQNPIVMMQFNLIILSGIILLIYPNVRVKILFIPSSNMILRFDSRLLDFNIISIFNILSIWCNGKNIVIGSNDPEFKPQYHRSNA